MLLLTSTSDKIQVITGSSGAISVHTSWVDNASGTITPGRTNTASITGTTTTDVVAAPASSTQRNVKFISVFNTHASVSNLITIQHTDGTNVEILWKATLLAGESVEFDANGDFVYYDVNGQVKTSAINGLFISASVKTSGTSFTTSARTNTLKLFLVGGGGGGGNATGNATQSAVASGGASGGYLEKTVSVTPNTTYTYAIGAGSAAGVAGGDTTFTVGGTTYTAKGGPAGLTVTQTNTTSTMFPGGAAPATSTNGDINGAGMQGGVAIRAPGTASTVANSFWSGCGGSSVLGGGANGSGTAGNGANANGYGSGGAGGLSNTASANNGGTGSTGVILIEEYT